MKHTRTHRIALIWIFVCLILMNAPFVWGFAEEPLYFRDPYTGLEADQKVSSVHTDLTHALALAAGFSDADAATILIWDQLTDSMWFKRGNNPPLYHNCLSTFPDTPDPNDPEVCPSGKGAGEVLFPEFTISSNGRDCVISRPGFFGPFFHFPRTDNGELENARKWAWGENKALRGYGAYAWGAKGAEPIGAACHYQRPMNIETGLQPGSLEAFGTYLHMLADSIHHRRCIADIIKLTQTLPGVFSYVIANPNREPKSCYYDWRNPSNYDENGVEFGSGNGTDRSDDASKAVYDELVRRSKAKEGKYCPLDWNTPLTAMAGSPTLQQACYNFIHNWGFQKDTGNQGEYAFLRRHYADQMVTAIRAQRNSALRPALTNISPAKSQSTGLGTDVMLTVNGREFASDAVVHWNGEVLDTTYINSRKLTATIQAAKIAAEGNSVITVSNPQGCGESAGKTFVYSYPSPALSALSPNSAVLNGPTFVLTLTGKNLVRASKVWWTIGSTTTELPATYVSSTQLQVQVTGPMLAKTGTARVQVETPGSKSLRSSKLAFKIK